MALTKQQLDEIENQMMGVWGYVKLKLGKDEISLRKSQLSQSSLGIVVYINGQLCFGWGWPDSDTFNPLTEKVWRTRKIQRYKPKEKARIIKNFGKRKAKEYFPNLDSVSVNYDPIYPTFGPLRSKLKKLEDLELIEEEKVT